MSFHYITASSYLKEPGKLELREAVQKLENEFGGLLCFAHNDLKGVDATNVRIFLTQKSVSIKENIPLFEEKMAEIISRITIEEIILFCSRMEVWDFLNFQLLQDLADHFRVDRLQSRLREYSTAVSIFKRNTKLVDFLRIWAGRNSLKTLPDSKPVFAKVKAIKWEDYTLEDVVRHEQYLASEFRLRQLVMRFSNAGEGCVLLMWLVTKSVASEMKKIMSGEEKPAFDSMTIEELNIGGTTFKVLTILFSFSGFFLLGTSDHDSIYICTKTALEIQDYRSKYLTLDQKAIVYFFCSYCIGDIRLWQHLPTQHQETRSVLDWQSERVSSLGAAVSQCHGRRPREWDEVVWWWEDKCIW